MNAIPGQDGERPGASRTVTGAEFILDAPPTVRALWGAELQVAWSSGEPLLIVGPPGVGKTTLGQQLALKRHGIGEPELLGLPVEPDPRPVLYMACDRPRQAAESFRRMVFEHDRRGLEHFRVWRGPLGFDIAEDPKRFTDLVVEQGVGTVVIDSLKDLALNLSDDRAGGAVGRALQLIVAEGVEVCAFHHQRKPQTDNRKPTRLDDVYGSTWITAAAGSVLLLWGEAGDPVVELKHLKQPSAEIGPLQLLHDHGRGETSVYEELDLCTLVEAAASDGGLTAVAAARSLFGSSEPTDAERERARRRLDRLVGDDRIGRLGGSKKEAARYVPIDRRRDG